MGDDRDKGELETVNAVGDVSAIAFCDGLKFMISIEEKSETITAAKFQSSGSSATIAAYSAFAELIAGKTVDEALQLANYEIAGFLGDLPSQEMHSSVERLLPERGFGLMSELFWAVKQAFRDTPRFSRLVLLKPDLGEEGSAEHALIRPIR
ncbi:iron-sulfur cluster assembly scaffold protein [Mesorhizobium kowhaii]|uniref:iron-sulfur cluster assembly scaffold protein n=1 Tax=Mesorhizobium kowhaii TaxID=1300272 RepID=UPI0035E6CF51